MYVSFHLSTCCDGRTTVESGRDIRSNYHLVVEYNAVIQPVNRPITKWAFKLTFLFHFFVRFFCMKFTSRRILHRFTVPNTFKSAIKLC